jgi:NhaA family Na+:H+ antiporter
MRSSFAAQYAISKSGRKPDGMSRNTSGNSSDEEVIPGPPLAHVGVIARILHHDLIATGLLLLAAVAAFVISNAHFGFGETTLAEWYAQLWHFEFGVAIDHRSFEQSLHHWINDGLMAIFFFIVGLEIKRELLTGELSSFRKALLPIVAALGGMIAPALIYSAFNYGHEGVHGWGIPMATDIAFAAGVIGLFSNRVPRALPVFLIALAIVDDLGAVAVIAIFYTETIEMRPLLVGIGGVLFSLLLGRLGFRNAWLYAILGGIIWFEFLASGVHATVAGVLFAFTIPASARYESGVFSRRLRLLLARYESPTASFDTRPISPEQQSIVRAIEDECIHVEAPLQRLEHKIHPMVVLLIVPLFAFANSGVQIDFSQLGNMLAQRPSLGIILGLVIGKQAGVFLSSWLTVKLGLAELPEGVSWKHLYGAACLAGIGFTMSLFIAQLAFPGAGHGTANMLLDEAKIGILMASIISGVWGLIVLALISPAKQDVPTASKDSH